MNKRALKLLLPLLIVAVIFVVPTVPNVHAATGVVCLEDPTSVVAATPCSSQTNPIFNGAFETPNHQLTIGVYVQGSDPLNGWDITLLTNHNFLIPSAVDFTNTITGPVSSVSLIVLCLQGTPKSGSPTCLSTDTIDTLHYSAVGTKTLAVPTTGLLFTAIYNITGITPAGGIPIQYQSGCAGAVSVPGLCVTITNGTPSPDSETAQIAHFDNSGTPSTGGTGTTGVPFVTISSSATSVGPLAAGATSSAITLTATSHNGWPNPFGTPDSILFTTSLPSSELPLVDPSPPGLTVTLAGTNPCATGGTMCSVTATFSAATPGTYQDTIFANFATSDFVNGQTSTLAAPITITITVVDFSISVSPNSYDMPRGGPFALGVVTITSLGSFNSPVTLTTTTSPTTGLTVTYSPNPVTPPPGGSVTSTISFSTAVPSGSRFLFLVTGTGGGITHKFPATGSMTVLVNGFNVTASPTTVSFTSGGAGGSSTLTVKSIGGTTNGFAGAVSFTASTTPATGLSVNCPSATLTAGGTATSNCTFTSSAPANVYTVVITGRGGTNIVGTTNGVVSNSTTLTVTVTGGIANPSIATTIRDASNAAVTSVTVGTTVHDTAVITNGSASGVTGSVVYNFFANLACSGVPASSQTVTVGAGGVVPDSNANTPSPAGSYSYNATYSGDTNNNPAKSACEPLTVNKASPTITTTLSATTITVGASVTDSSTMASFFQAGGTVTYNRFSGSTCAGTATVVSTVTVTNGVVPNSAANTPTPAGSYSFDAVYSGDVNNNAATSACEPLTVNKASPTITTTLSATTITVGASVTDSSTMASFFQAGGTVTYNEFTGGTCAGTATVVSTVTVTNGVVPNSASVTPTPAGAYSFNAVYSGDVNNNAATSACEPLTVNKASPTITTTLSATTITVGASVTDSSTMASFFQAGGSVTYNRFSGSTCAGTATVVSTVTVTNGVVPNSAANTPTPAGAYSFNAVYSGDANNNVATSACEPLTVNKASPTITTTLSATTITVGTSVTDSSTMASFFQAGGTVTYNEFTGGTCAGTATVVSTVTVTNGVVPNSAAVTPSPAGSFSFNAVYSGDVNNNVATSACEPLTVNKASPTIATTLSATTITVGASVTDSSTMASFFQAGGTVTYNRFSGGTCAGTATVVSTVTVTNGVVPNSAANTPTPAGAYSFNAVYSGDANNNAATSACEPLTVNKASPTLATTLSSTTPAVGTSVTDSATLSSFFQAGGTVTYSVFANGLCTAPGTVVSTVTVTNGVIPNSRAVLFNATGSFSFSAAYSGDVNNNAATSACEPLTVQKASPTITTTLSATTITVGGSVTDSSTMASFFQAGGTVTYNRFSGATCAGTATVVSTVTVTNGVVPNSAANTPTPAGAYSFNAVYSGDANNNAATSACEPLTVNKATPTIATSLSSTTPVVGTTVTDSSTLASFFQAGGTVQYNVYTNGACTAPFTTVSTVTVTNGVVPNSRAVLFNSTGAFAFQAVYSGDVNNNAATSTCEPLTVQKASPTITTTLSATTITVGASVTDSSTMASFFQAGGTVTYNRFSGSTCAGTATVVSTVTVTNGVVPNSAANTPTPAGAYSFNAVYSGDANNNAATSACEPLTVNKASPTITTTLSATTITVGTSVTDSSTMASFFQAGGTVTYNEFSGGTCAGTATVVSTVTVTNGVVPNSASVTPSPAGSFSFNAVYSGDVNNNVATSACEPLTVNKASPTIATTLSATTITVGASVTDSSTMASFFQAGGTVTYNRFSGGTCAGTATVVSTVTVTNGVVPNSAANTPTPAGAYSFNAVYSGDVNNNAATSACEPLTVNKASPIITTTLSSNSVRVGQTVTDSATMASFFQAGGTVTYNLFSNGACTAPGSAVSTVTVTNGVVPNSRAVLFNATGSFSFNAVYSGDANNNAATSACEPLSVITGVGISTTLSSTTPVVGTTVTDSATLSGQTATAGGTVTYSDFANGLCTAPGTVVSIVTVTNGVVPNSRAVLFNATGSFSFQASYSGDANNNAATSACEPLTVQKASPTITTTLSATTITVGASVTDSSTMASFFQAGGTVTYNRFSGSTCAGTATVVSTVTVTNGVVPNSAANTPTPAGAYSFNAVYSGDVNNNAATSACEPLTVNKASPTIATTLSATTITVGQSVTDSSTLTNSFSAGGTVTYNLFVGSSTCAVTGSVVSTVTVTNGVVPNSRSVTFNATNAGGYSWNAVYSGDANNNGATSPCEPLTVNPSGGVTIATSLSSTSIVVGNSVTDSATLAGATATASGTVTYNDFANGACTAPGTVVSLVTVTNAVVPNSRAVTFNSTGSFSFNAVYSGDANNGGATSPCEPLTVNKISPTIATTLSATTITVGGSVSDSSVLSNFYKATGTVTYEFFTGSTCAGTATTVGTPVTVTNGVVPNSASQAFNSAGSFSWNAVYSGDANNNGATSACEPLTVQKASPTIATTLSSTSIVVGNTVTDSSTLTSSFNAGGTVTYSVFTNGACTAPGTAVSTVTVTGGVVPNSRAVRFNSTGSFSFNAVYSGDANNNGATSPCEPLTVTKASPTIATTLSATTITVGQSVTDSSTLTNSFSAGGTVQYDLFTNGACTAPFTIVSTVTVTGGVVPNSRAVTFNVTGPYSFQAVYSGDANNNGATSPCEPLQVNPAGGIAISTSLSATSITVGGSVFDSATLTGTTATAGGTVTYNLFTNGACTAPGKAVSVVTVTNHIVPNSRSVTFNSTGAFSFNAVYSGDASNGGATSTCEPLTVNKVSPTIATTLSATTITVGSSVTDSSTLTGGFQAGGSVTYEFFTGSTCAGTATTVGTPVTVTNGVVPNSASQAFNSPGSFSWNAVYSGDANNNGATSACEPLTVNKATVVLTTAVSPSTSITIGGSVNDQATLAGGFPSTGVTGTVTYNFFSNGACTAPATSQVVNVGAGNSVPASSPTTPATAGSYSFNAVYSGDANNNAVTSACEPFTINDFTLTAATTSITVSVGSSSAPDLLTMTSLGGFTGSITLSTNTLPTGVFAMFVPNPVSINTAGASSTSNLTISVSTSTAPQTFSLIVTGTNMTLTHTVTITVTITAPAVPSFTDGKLHWTHHLSLMKSSTQSWTAVVSNPLATSANLVVRIIGSAVNNPTETFDITCGVTCVNTASGGVNATPGLTPVSVASGAKTSFSFSQMNLTSFVNLKVTFTAQLWWTTGSTYQMSPTVKSGAFDVVP